MQTYKDIAYTVRRSKRKTASIFIERDGQVALIVPNELPMPKIEDILEKKRLWIYKGLAEWEDLNAAHIEREYVNGEGFLYLGRTYRLKIVEEQSSELQLKGGHFCLNTSTLNDAKRTPDDAFKAFYRAKGLEKIPPRLQLYQSKMGITAKNIRIMDLGYRWASCSTDNTLNFHWMSMMAPMTVLDYIIVHELAHIRHKRHTEAFWEQVDKVLPSYAQQQAWLRKHGASFSL